MKPFIPGPGMSTPGRPEVTAVTVHGACLVLPGEERPIPCVGLTVGPHTVSISADAAESLAAMLMEAARQIRLVTEAIESRSPVDPHKLN